jgi:hypothetical protein
MAEVRKRNVNKDPATKVYGISASTGFWEQVAIKCKETGQGRSSVIVEALAEYWGLINVASKSVGRPKKKMVKQAHK